MNHKNSQLGFPIGVYVVALLYLVMTYALMVVPMDEKTFTVLVGEDEIFETLAALSFFVTAGLFLTAYFRSQNSPDHGRVKRLLYLALAAIFFVGGGEEMSWGQRLLGLEPPAVSAAINPQSELTVHNLSIFYGPNLFFNTDRLATLFFFTLALGIPLLATLVRPAGRFFNRILSVPPWTLGLLFLANYGLANGAKIALAGLYSHVRPLGAALIEIKESNYAILSVLFASYIVLYMVKPERVGTVIRAES